MKPTILILCFFCVFAFAGTNTLLSVPGGVVKTSHVNQYYTAFNQDLVPRNSLGVPTDEAGSVGTDSFVFKDAHIKSGYWSVGDIKCKHTFNGLIPTDQGWMIMDGSIINEANYDSQHSTGDWDNYIGASILDGKNLPDMVGKYITHANTTTQTGASAITAVGNANNTVNLQHAHQNTNVQFQWYNSTGTVPTHTSWLFGGAGQTFDSSVTGGSVFGVRAGDCSGSNTCIAFDAWTNPQVWNTDNSLSTTQSIRPESIEFVCYMRIT